MEKIWSVQIDEILCRGRSLQGVGVNNWGLDRESALVAIDEITNLGNAILGGDVYLLNEGRLQVSRDGWYCERNTAENEAAFAKRAAEKAKAYIESYPRRGSEVLFAIVPNTKGIRENREAK